MLQRPWRRPERLSQPVAVTGECPLTCGAIVTHSGAGRLPGQRSTGHARLRAPASDESLRVYTASRRSVASDSTCVGEGRTEEERCVGV